MKTKPIQPKKPASQPLRASWYNHRFPALGLGVLSLGLAYLLALRALDTGSLQQYFLTLVLLGFGLNRVIRAVRLQR